MTPTQKMRYKIEDFLWDLHDFSKENQDRKIAEVCDSIENKLDLLHVMIGKGKVED